MFKKRSFCFWKTLKNRKGFTLAELTVTLSILGIMTAISIPSYISWLPRHKLQTSVRQIYDDLNLAKIRAVKDNTYACITFDVGNNNYTVFLDPDGSSNLTPGDTTIKGNVTLENGVDITAANTCGFNNRGMLPTIIAPPVQVSLTNPTGIIMRIDVNTAGGISILTSKDGGATWS
ncbi:MAG: GspH/FimT family pseudopilin [Desulfobacteraceae bacterium]|nr:GspH/FimT family pseudopilin [Desulfobacteraceae bacterium]